MGRRLIRVCLVDVLNDLDEWRNLSIDLFLNEYGEASKAETYGHWGRPYRRRQTESRNIWPFMVTTDSNDRYTKLDFGQMEDEIGNLASKDYVRFGLINITAEPVTTDSQVQMLHDSVTYNFKILRMTYLDTEEIFHPLTARIQL